MAWPLLRVTNEALNQLYRALFILDCVSLVIVSTCFIEAIHFSCTTGHYIQMVSFTDGIILPVLIALVALCALPVHVGGIYISYQIEGGRVSERVMHWLNYFVIATLLIVICILCVIITSSVHTHALERGLHSRISASMKSYGTDEDESRNLDLLQILFQCCGSKSYKEWFFVRWDPLMPEQLSPGTVVSDDVPFSCCLQNSLYPCIHNHVSSSSHVYQYDPTVITTVSGVGCLKVLIAKAQTTSSKASLWLALFLLWEVILLIGKRLQHTSMCGMTDSSNGTMLREVWLLGSSPTPTFYTDDQGTDDESQALMRDEYSTPSKSNTNNT